MILDDSRLDDTALHNGSKDAEVISGLVQAGTKVEDLGSPGVSWGLPFSSIFKNPNGDDANAVRCSKMLRDQF